MTAERIAVVVQPDGNDLLYSGICLSSGDERSFRGVITASRYFGCAFPRCVRPSQLGRGALASRTKHAPGLSTAPNPTTTTPP